MLGRLVTLETFENAMQAHLVKNILEAAGIRCVIADEFAATAYWHLSNAMGGIKLQVAEEDLERAEQVLEELERSHKSERTASVEALARRDRTDDSGKILEDSAVGPEVQPTEQDVEAKPVDPDDVDDPPLNARELTIERAYKAVLVGLVLLPVQFYATWLLAEIWQSELPIRPEMQKKLRWTIGLNLPLLVIGFLFTGFWLRGMASGLSGF